MTESDMEKIIDMHVLKSIPSNNRTKMPTRNQMTHTLRSFRMMGLLSTLQFECVSCPTQGAGTSCSVTEQIELYKQIRTEKVLDI